MRRMPWYPEGMTQEKADALNAFTTGVMRQFTLWLLSPATPEEAEHLPQMHLKGVGPVINMQDLHKLRLARLEAAEAIQDGLRALVKP